MGVSLSTAKWLAPTSFLFNFAAQQYGIFSHPSMKEVNDAHVSFFSPHPYSIAGFFFPQQIFQLVWMYKLIRSNPRGGSTTQEKKDTNELVDYVPWYILGNLCIGSWMFAWNSENLKLSNVFVMINSLSQLYYVVFRQGMNNIDTNSTASILTHIVSKTFAGIGVLDLLHNTSVGFFENWQPNFVIKVLTGLGFAAAGSVSDWIFGGCLVWDLAGLCAGQLSLGNQGWGQLLGVYAAFTGLVVLGKNLTWPPYRKRTRSQEDDPLAYGSDEDEDLQQRV